MKRIKYQGKNYVFSSSKYCECFTKFRKSKGLKVDDLEQSLADKLFVQKSTVHSWRFGPSGPTDLNVITNLAEELELMDCTLLLKEATMVTKLTDLQLQSAKRIYDAFVEFLHEFDITGGFTTLMWYDLQEKGSSDPESDIYDYIEGLEDKIRLIILKEYFYLHDLAIYNEFISFLYDDLFETYNGKLGYAYRFEAFADGNPTTEDDYSKAMDKLNSIIEKYN